MRADRRAFTLIEIIAGLALVGVVFTSLLLLLDQLRDGRDRLIDRARMDNAVANGAEALRLMFARAEAQGDTAGVFTGTEDGAQFRSWCEVPGGWLERCIVRLAIERTGDSSFVRAELSTGERTTLMQSVGAVRLRYFAVTGTEAQWIPSWTSGSVLPSAVGLFAPHDTTVTFAGGRG